MQYQILIKSNLDRYPSNYFPSNLPFIPRKGEFVAILSEYENMLKSYPLVLEVIQVTYYDKTCIVDVYYSDSQIRTLKLLNRDL